MPISKTVRLTRRVAFSAGHRMWLEGLSEGENKRLFGEYASKFNHGHNYVLDVSVEGPIDLRTGMVVNIKVIDDVIRTHLVSRLHLKSLNDEVQELSGRAPCLENVLDFMWNDLSASDVMPPQVTLRQLRLEEMPDFWGTKTMTKTTLTRVYEFAASHRLHAPALSDADNQSLFGKCNNPNGHGHNYGLEVTVSGTPDPVTGMIVDFAELDAKVHELVVDRYDHKNLNEDLPEFQNKATTSEAIGVEIFERLKAGVPGKLESIRLLETARSIFEVSAE
jgi:6-pyruvoyltetrahydropterin/6-carboxytetrahydropterin synthase